MTAFPKSILTILTLTKMTTKLQLVGQGLRYSVTVLQFKKGLSEGQKLTLYLYIYI